MFGSLSGSPSDAVTMTAPVVSPLARGDAEEAESDRRMRVADLAPRLRVNCSAAAVGRGGLDKDAQR